MFPNMSTRVRFAPSPTGQVHIGNIRAAIFNWLFARHEGGRFLLRIEDTDRERSTPEALEAVMAAMNWLGLEPDEPPLFQSTRTDAHIAAAEQLLSNGLAFKEDKGGTGKGDCVIFRMPAGTDSEFDDIIKGRLTKKAEDMKDFVIVRSDGSPVFHLANVVDDIFMGITHVIRGDDHVENTFRHIALYKALGADVPRYAHLPMIVNAQGKPYSKRDGDAYVGDFRQKGYYADALFNYLSLLGWSPGDDREQLTRQELTDAFTLERVRSSASQMDLKKLTFLNGRYLADMSAADFETAASAYAGSPDWLQAGKAARFSEVCRLLQSRTKTLADVREWTYFFDRMPAYDQKAVDKLLRKEGVGVMLSAFVQKLGVVGFDHDSIESALRAAEAEAGLKEGKLNQPVRVSITGITTGAGICETMLLLGKDSVIARLTHAATNLCG